MQKPRKVHQNRSGENVAAAAQAISDHMSLEIEVDITREGISRMGWGFVPWSKDFVDCGGHV